MSQMVIGQGSVPARRPLRVVVAAFGGLRALVAGWAKRQRERAALLALDDAGLKDIGISRAQAAFDHSKPFWRG